MGVRVQVKHIGFAIRGFYPVAKLRQTLAMKGKTAEKGFRILRFWRKYGLKATRDAHNVSRRRLCRWEQQLSASGGKLEALLPKSTRPKSFRKTRWRLELPLEIRRLRQVFPKVGMEKPEKLLGLWCHKHGLPVPPAFTIGRIIARAPDKMRASRPPLSARGRPKARRSGKVRVWGKRRDKPDLWALDTITLVAEGLRGYIVCLVTERSRVALAFATSVFSSRQTGGFLRAFVHTPFLPSADTSQPPLSLPWFVPDNVPRFAGGFENTLTTFGLGHLCSHPRSRKENPFVERFNRTLQAMFVNFHLHLLFTDLNLFNRKLANFLILYNTKLPHHALKLKTPIQVFAESTNLCHKLWTNTRLLVGWRRCAITTIGSSQDGELFEVAEYSEDVKSWGGVSL